MILLIHQKPKIVSEIIFSLFRIYRWEMKFTLLNLLRRPFCNLCILKQFFFLNCCIFNKKKRTKTSIRNAKENERERKKGRRRELEKECAPTLNRG